MQKQTILSVNPANFEDMATFRTKLEKGYTVALMAGGASGIQTILVVLNLPEVQKSDKNTNVGIHGLD